MCSKPVSAQAGKGGCSCSGPRKIDKCNTRQLCAGQDPSLFLPPRVHTVLLFQAHTPGAQVCVAPDGGLVRLLTEPAGLHASQLRRVFGQGRVAHYEWQLETSVYRTTLLPLISKDGQVDEVLSATQNISTWQNTPQTGVQTLHDGSAPKTFAQLLLAARETEKREVAKALHDEVGTACVMLAALLNLAKQSVKKGNNRQALKDLDRLQVQTQESMQRLRNIIVTLRPPSLDTDGALRGSVEELIKDVCGLGRLSHRFICPTTMREKGISDRVKILLYRLVQEALSNVVKHAQATRVKVQLKRVKEDLFITVEDNGVGFIPAKRSSIHHVGLRSMQDSVRLVGGQLKIVSAPGKGTQIHAVFPCVVYEENQ